MTFQQKRNPSSRDTVDCSCTTQVVLPYTSSWKISNNMLLVAILPKFVCSYVDFIKCFVKIYKNSDSVVSSQGKLIINMINFLIY